MKRPYFVLLVLTILLACGFVTTMARADVRVQIASTHEESTKQFEVFAEEFDFTFRDLYLEFASVVPAFLLQEKLEKPKVFYLIERRDKGLWQIGLCEPKNDNLVLGTLSAELSFKPPIWVVEGSQLKDNETVRELAREAAKALINKIKERVI
jgi:hypothetical protein